jgi:predicted porin
MNKKLGMAVAGAVMAFGASAANAGITIPAGDWTIDIGGNVNAYYSNTRFDGILDNDVDGAPGGENANTISTGLLPAALGIGGKTRQNDLDIAFQFTFFTGVDSNSEGTVGSGSGYYGGDLGQNNGAGGNSLNIRQAYMTFGDASWGTIKMGRDLGIFGSDAILSDMTLLGVGTGAGGNGSSTLGRIGSGYIYADWVGQIAYHSPNWNGFSFAAAARQPWGNSDNSDIGFDAKVSYEWAGDVSGKVWVGGLHQKVDNSAADPALFGASHDEDTVKMMEIGGKVSFGGLTLVGYYYDGEGAGLPVVVRGNTPSSGLGLWYGEYDVDGGYVQATYTIPGIGTKVGASWGQSKIDQAGGDFKNESWIVGAYHPLTKSLNLVAEYTDTDYDNVKVVNDVCPVGCSGNGGAKTISLGAIMFF